MREKRFLHFYSQISLPLTFDL